jgi:hypothetical protein
MVTLIGGLVMKRHFVLVIILILLGLFIAFSAAAHPYDSPLTFIPHKTEDGRIIYTNIPKRCFSNRILTCTGYHPIYKGNSHLTVPLGNIVKQPTAYNYFPVELHQYA